jgi:hypothetical protein
MRPAGLPHSDTPGSQVASTSPGSFAGSRVLHRLRVPRHPPYALGSLPKAFLQVDSFIWRFNHHNKTISQSIVKEQPTLPTRGSVVEWTLTGSNR